jgi:hypothetical protein
MPSWKLWCEGVGEPPGTQNTFSKALERAGFERCRIGHGRGFAGLALKASSSIAAKPVARCPTDADDLSGSVGISTKHPVSASAG